MDLGWAIWDMVAALGGLWPSWVLTVDLGWAIWDVMATLVGFDGGWWPIWVLSVDLGWAIWDMVAALLWMVVDGGFEWIWWFSSDFVGMTI